ncbi:hypothetical protein BJ170DRAFT_572535 [Xylariales sp. AK1849]|nr:hypothetical protein BJ170DRAFT_572535 [Xylariales sp. AK1849]
MDAATPPTMDRKSEKMSIDHGTPPAFERLPDEIIQQILQVTDPNSFASLVLLNSKWRRVSQQAHLYAHHLSRCPSHSASHNVVPIASVKDESLPKLRHLFAREVKRNLFEAYLRPRTTKIKLVSNSISSSSVPGGEGMQFSPSPRGHHLLAYNSSRIHVLDVRGPDLEVKRELKILRQPVSTCILDDGSLLAVLSSDTQVDLYDLREHPPRRTQSLILDHTPRTIALSPCGSVLAAAYEGGIEVSSLHMGALSTDRRAVKCDGVDSLAFSFDGTQLLGTTTIAQPPNTVILTAPYYDPGAQTGEESISALWTTSILFPNTSRDCSHAVLLQESSSQEASWTFTYDRSFETFRAVRIDDLRNGTTYFTGPIPNSASQTTLLPCTLPAATYCGELVSAGFEGRDVWLYGVPEDLEAIPDTSSSASESVSPGLNRRNSALSVRSPSRVQEPAGGRVPQWQILCDRNRNTFVSGRRVTGLDGVNTVKWVAEHGDFSFQERLIVAARGVQPPKPITEEDGIDFVDGGRVTILDFDYGLENGKENDIIIEVGTKEPEVLEEEHRDMATEVAIVRRRTVAQRSGGRTGVMRAATSAAHHADSLLLPPVSGSSNDDTDDPLIPRRMTGPRTEAGVSAEEAPEDVSLEEAQEALDAPYAHANPRSGTTLRRAATAAAVNRRLHPSAATAGRVEYRRADGRAEHPHESDADNWVPPPPPYAKEDPVDMPAFLRHAAIPGIGLNTANEDAQTTAASSANVSSFAQAPRQVPPHAPPMAPPSAPPAVTGRAPRPPSGLQTRPELPRLHTSPIRDTNYDADINGVSPDGSPPQVAQIPARIQGSGMNSERRVHPSPHAPSSGTLSSGSAYTPASSAYHSANTGSSRGSANPYSLNLAIPSPSRSNPMLNDDLSGQSPSIGMLPNAQTWPRASQSDPETAAILTGYPHSAPAIDGSNAGALAAAMLPLPRADQLASLNNRGDSGAPRRASGMFQLPRVPVGRHQEDRGRPSSMRNSQVLEIQRAPPEPERPLIISTPKGVTGALDPPGRLTSQTNESEPVILAPVPRHPRPTAGSGPLRPTAERLETIYSIASTGGRSIGNDGGHYDNYRGQPIIVPPPPSSQLTASSLRHHTSLTRRQSRARRSAAKNVQDAKTRGWTGRRQKKKKQKDTDALSSVWTDVTWASRAPTSGQTKEKRCVIM